MPTSRWIAAIVGLSLLACADRREPVAREHLREKAASESGGALTLASMTKTNGFDHERDGMKLHTIEWDATLQMHRDGWKAGWRDFQVLPVAPSALAAAVEGASVRRILRGGKAVLQGKSELQKADRGWRVLKSEVTAFKILAPADAPSEGRSTDIQAFFRAFKEAIATKDPQVLSKFMRFPYRWEERSIEQGQFTSSEFPFTDDQVKEILNIPSLTRHDEGSFRLSTAQFVLYFVKDGDDYWKLTSVYSTEVTFSEGRERDISFDGTESNTSTEWVAPSERVDPASSSISLFIESRSTGDGRVTSSPTGIDCEITNVGGMRPTGDRSGRCDATFAYGQIVTLTARPYENSTFGGWEAGPCEGTGSCRVAMSRTTSVRANFAVKNSQ
jgi:hypothetical protein